MLGVVEVEVVIFGWAELVVVEPVDLEVEVVIGDKVATFAAGLQSLNELTTTFDPPDITSELGSIPKLKLEV